MLGFEAHGIDPALVPSIGITRDNRCSTHARDDFPSDQRRLMLRTTVQGTVRPY